MDARRVTAVLVADARARGIETVFLSAGDDDVARVYGLPPDRHGHDRRTRPLNVPDGPDHVEVQRIFLHPSRGVLPPRSEAAG
ncbi:hypothetical protein [Sphaerisporangium album]|uniref:hypothetical protein n=1 Tax=Sphaerisporangium album TaxID=509200 RepID=UPI001C689983|nr:hypothetical protein [Sphaerisporangium album]